MRAMFPMRMYVCRGSTLLLEAVEVEEVAFQAGCQAAELRAVLATALAQPQRKLSNMHSRIHKHLGATAPKLAAEVPVRLFPFLAGDRVTLIW